jgi:hypothetical protein
MSIINQKFINLFKDYPLYSQEHVEDKLVIAKLFDIAGNATWYLTEFDPEQKNAFGYVTGMSCDEWGYIHIPELEKIKHLSIPRIERDLYFNQKPISEFVPELGKGDYNG